MTSQSTNLDLTLYDAGDTSETFSDFRIDMASSSGSNMAKIDAFAGEVEDGACIIIDTSGTASAYTASGVTLLDGSTAFPSTVPTGTKILLKPNVSNSGACTLQVNSGDINSLQKVYAQTDGLSALQAGDLQTAKYYLFFFNGSAWVLLDTVTLNQVVVDDATNGDLTFSTTTNTYTVKTGAITLPKIANISSGVILGRSSAGSGVVEELTPADVISVLDLANALIYLGTIDCSTNPNYPEGNAGDVYVVSSAGKIGGASGIDVEAGDFIICNTDNTPSGDEVTVGQYWDVLQTNIDGAITGTGSSVAGNIPEIVGTDMAVLQDSGYSPAELLDTDNHTSGTTNKVYTATEQTKLAGIDDGANAGASASLDNLASVAINTSLVSDTDATNNLGSAAIKWLQGFMNRLALEEGGSTATPASGDVALYAKADGLLYSKDDAGTETLVSGGSSGVTFKNLLVNGDGIVHQRAETITSTTKPANNDDTWVGDRVLLLSDGNDIVDYSQETTVLPTGASTCHKFEVETANKQFAYAQILTASQSPKIIGGVASLSFKARMGAVDDNTHSLKAVVLSWDGTADTVTSDMVSTWGATATFVANWTAENTPVSNTLTTNFQTFTIENISIDTAGATNVAVLIYCDQTDGAIDDVIYIGDIQLEEGETATDFERLSYEIQLVWCKFYLRVVATDGGFDRIAHGPSDTTNTGNAFLGLADMRAKPSLLYSDLSHYAYGGETPTAIGVTYTTKSNLILDITVAGTPFTVNYDYEFRDANVASKLQFLSEM